jgi:hypothetical protein
MTGGKKQKPLQMVGEIRTYNNYLVGGGAGSALANMYEGIVNTELAIQDYLDKMVLSGMKSNLASLMLENQELEEKTLHAESVADTLSGYTFLGKNESAIPANSVAELQESHAIDGMVKTTTPTTRTYGTGVRFGPVQGDDRLFKPGDWEYLGGPTKYGTGGGVRVSSLPTHQAAQYETVSIDPATGKFASNMCKTGSPTHGCLNANGMVYSKDYGQFVQKGMFDTEEGYKDKFQKEAEERATQREKEWKEYWKTHGESFDEQLKEKLKAVWEAEQGVKESEERIRLYDKVIPELEARVKKTDLLSREQITSMSRTMISAVEKGASEDDLKKIAQKYLAIGMNEAEAVAAEEEETKAYTQLITDVAHTALSINSIVNPVSGTLLEMGVSAYEGYMESGVKGALWNTAKYTLPVNAAEALHNGGSYKEVLMALLQDAGNVVQLVGVSSGLKGNKAGAVDKLDDISTGTPATRADRAASQWAEHCVSNPSACTEKLKIEAERSKAFIAGRMNAETTVGDFQKLLDAGADSADDIKKAVANIQKDKHALQLINEADDATKLAFKNELKKIYDKTDETVKNHFTDKYARKYGDKFVEVEIFKPTNPKPSSKVTVSYDRDITVRVKTIENGKEIVRDIPARELEEVYNPAFYEAAGGQKVTGYKPHEADKFAHDMDQACTDRLHAEAYGNSPEDLDVALYNPAGSFSDPEQVGQAMSYKANHWYEKAVELADKGDFSQAEAAIEEGMRQTTKQFDNQLVKRVEAMNQKLAATGRTAVTIPDGLEKAINVMKRVGTGPGQGFTPSEAETLLKNMGWTPREVGYEMGKYVESLQKLSPV